MARRSAHPPDIIEFAPGRRLEVVAVMRRLLRDRDGWINVAPDVAPEDIPAGAGEGSMRLFSARGPSVPLGTWVPGERRRDGSFEPVSLGLQHAGGPKALWKLRDLGHPMREGWKSLSDHPRRGFVISVPSEEDPDATLVWLIEAAVRLTPFSLPERWHAGMYHQH